MGVIQNLGKWQNYVHYFLLMASIFGGYHLSALIGIDEFLYLGFPRIIIAILFYTVALIVADTIIRVLFSIAPEPLKWEDN